MMLIDEAAVPTAALPLAALRDHLRLGTAFAGDAFQEPMLEAHLRAALAAIEGRIAKALLARSFRLVLTAWRDPQVQPLPLAPVLEVASVTLVDAAGGTTAVPPDRWLLRPDSQRPRLAGSPGQCLPAIPEDGTAEVVFTAGWPGWPHLPPDLAQAVLLLAAEFYETRHEAGERSAGLPATVQALTERWRTIRLLGAGRLSGAAR